VQDVLQAIAPVHPEVAQMQTELQARIPPLVLDPARLRLLVRNLVDNALRHTPAGGKLPVVSLLWREGQLEFTVRDHGAGVEAPSLSRLAEPFYRPDAARERATGGVGLGLYLCRLVAQAHGGALVIANAQPGLEVQARFPAPATKPAG